MAKAEYRSAIRSRKLINAALADLLQEKPLDKITVSDVVRRAEINRGTFYAHYSDIPDVIDHLIQNTFSHIRDVLSEQSLQLSQVPHVLLTRIQMILEEDLDLYRKILSSGVSGLMQERLTDIVLEYLMENETAFSTTDHEQYVMSIRFCAGGLMALYRDWFAGELTFSLSELTRRSEQMLNGILQGL